MRLSKLFPKTKKSPPKDAVAVNHKLLVQAGFIDQLMVGSWTLLPLGWRVVSKINNIIREELNATGAQEMLMPLMHPKEIWNETGRWETADEVMYKLKDGRGKEFVLSFTHEEIVMDLIRKHVQSYADLPVKIYHFSTKFRNEARPTGGILRGREFLMKDLYSVHESEKDGLSYYEEVKKAYIKAFNRMGLNVIVTEAGGGVFTDRRTHEFQVIAEVGEDTIYYCPKCQYGYNQEIFQGKVGENCQKCSQEKLQKAQSIEVGNIFPLGTWYAEKMGVFIANKEGKRVAPWFASYGIGPTRTMGAIVEVYHDEKGIVWPESVAPYQIHLVDLVKSKIKNQKSKLQIKNQKEKEEVGDKIYEDLTRAGFEVLSDDREDVSAGEKFADADLVGCPYRVVVSEKTLEKDSVEVKKRYSKNTQLVPLKSLVEFFRKEL